MYAYFRKHHLNAAACACYQQKKTTNQPLKLWTLRIVCNTMSWIKNTAACWQLQWTSWRGQLRYSGKPWQKRKWVTEYSWSPSKHGKYHGVVFKWFSACPQVPLAAFQSKAPADWICSSGFVSDYNYNWSIQDHVTFAQLSACLKIHTPPCLVL